MTVHFVALIISDKKAKYIWVKLKKHNNNESQRPIKKKNHLYCIYCETNKAPTYFGSFTKINQTIQNKLQN